MPALGPQAVSGGFPVFRIRRGAVAEGIRRLGTLIVGGYRACLPDHGPQLLRILQHGTGPEHVLVEGLAIMVGHEDGGLQGVQQRAVADVYNRRPGGHRWP